MVDGMRDAVADRVGGPPILLTPYGGVARARDGRPCTLATVTLRTASLG
jgi:hypothetical protein